MARTRKSYKEGDWFEIKLPEGTAIGIVARTSRRGVLGGYFFGPIAGPIDESSFRSLRKEDSIFVCIFGDVGIVSGDWRLFGRMPVWNRIPWCLPDFAYLDPVDPNLAFRRVYDDNDPIQLPEESVVSIDVALTMPTDGVFGHRVVEAWLGKLFRGEALPNLRAPRRQLETDNITG